MDVFFFCSGLLVMSSWWHAPSLRAFALARAARVLPGMWAMVALSVPVLFLFSQAGAAGYFLAPETWTYVLKNSTLFFGTTGNLPRVFENNPLAGAVNGSLWTLPQEVRCYALLAVVGLLARWVGRHQRRLVNLAWVLLALALASAALLLRAGLRGGDDPSSRLLMMFALGALAYLVLVLAYLPGGALRQFNRLGDYSYGVYIYAFPVQQAVTALSPQIGLPAHIARCPPR